MDMDMRANASGRCPDLCRIHGLKVALSRIVRAASHSHRADDDKDGPNRRQRRQAV
jgi:hypothetical protein